LEIWAANEQIDRVKMTTTTAWNGLKSRVWRVGTLAILVLATSCAPSGPVIEVEPSVSSLQVDTTARVPVSVKNIANLTAYEVHLSFDANVLEVTELKDGGFIKPDFVIQNIFDNAAGTIDYAVAQINRPPANGSGMLFEIVFRAKVPGYSLIHFRETPAVPMGVLLSDSNGVAIQILLTNGNMNVSD
jgi:hypothetical protein